MYSGEERLNEVGAILPLDQDSQHEKGYFVIFST